MKKSLASYLLFLLLSLNTYSLIAQIRQPEQKLGDLLAKENAMFFLKSASGKPEGSAFPVSFINNTELPQEEKVKKVIPENKVAEVNAASNLQTEAAAESEESASTFKKPSPLLESDVNIIYMHEGAGNGNYFQINFNYTTNLPLSIDFMSSNDVIIRFIYNPETGDLDEYLYQDSRNISAGSTSTPVVKNKLYVYNKTSEKKEVNANEADKIKMLATSKKVKDLFSKLWFLYKDCPTVLFSTVVDQDYINQKLDSLLSASKGMPVSASDNKAIVTALDGTTIQVLYTVSRDGINIERSSKITGLVPEKGSIADAKVKREIDSILYKAVTMNLPEYRCLAKKSTKEISFLIKNNVLVSVEQ